MGPRLSSAHGIFLYYSCVWGRDATTHTKIDNHPHEDRQPPVFWTTLLVMAHAAPAHPEQPADAPAPPGEEAHVPPTLVGVLLAVALVRSAVADFCVLWQAGALLSTSKEMRDARGEFLATRTTLEGSGDLCCISCCISAAGLCAYGRWCPQLSYVNLSFSEEIITDATLRALWQGCPQLLHVDLKGCGGEITDAAVIALAKNCKQLSYLNLDDCREITDAAVIALAQGCPQLSSLDLSRCRWITKAVVFALAQGCKQLSSLNLSYCWHINDSGVIALAQNCPQLSSLNLRWCRQITDAAVFALAKNCKQLSSLNLRGTNDKITDAAVLALAQGCPLLTKLDLWASMPSSPSAAMAIALEARQQSLWRWRQ